MGTTANADVTYFHLWLLTEVEQAFLPHSFLPAAKTIQQTRQVEVIRLL